MLEVLEVEPGSLGDVPHRHVLEPLDVISVGRNPVRDPLQEGPFG